jgi:hypothetical protein
MSVMNGVHDEGGKRGEGVPLIVYARGAKRFIEAATAFFAVAAVENVSSSVRQARDECACRWRLRRSAYDVSSIAASDDTLVGSD